MPDYTQTPRLKPSFTTPPVAKPYTLKSLVGEAVTLYTVWDNISRVPPSSSFLWFIFRILMR